MNSMRWKYLQPNKSLSEEEEVEEVTISFINQNDIYIRITKLNSFSTNSWNIYSGPLA